MIEHRGKFRDYSHLSLYRWTQGATTWSVTADEVSLILLSPCCELWFEPASEPGLFLCEACRNGLRLAYETEAFWSKLDSWLVSFFEAEGLNHLDACLAALDVAPELRAIHEAVLQDELSQETRS